MATPKKAKEIVITVEETPSKVVLITTTNNRPEAIAALERSLKQQTYEYTGFRWIICTDGEGEFPSWAEVVKRKGDAYYCKNQKVSSMVNCHSMLNNLYAGLSWANNPQNVLICEDDEYYSPFYVSAFMSHLYDVDMAGVNDAIYYRLPNRSYYRLRNDVWATLAMTGFKGAVIPVVKALIMENNLSLDLMLWQRLLGIKTRLVDNLWANKPLCVSFKGFRGSQGIGRGHALMSPNDFSMNRLKDILATREDYDYYSALIKSYQVQNRYEKIEE